MRVVIRPARGHEKCRDCDLRFVEANAFHCAEHDRIPNKVYIHVHGNNNRDEFYEDLDGDQLTLIKASVMKERIQKEIKKGIYNRKKYQKRSKRLYLFKNYKQKYLSKMRQRNSLTKGADGWLSNTALNEIAKYHKNYLHHFDEFDISDIRTVMIKNYLDSVKLLDGKAASNTVKRKIIGNLRHMLRWAVSQEDMNIAPEMPRVKKSKRNITVLTPEHQDELLSYLPEEPKMHHLILDWARHAGRRPNEYRATKIRDIYFSKGTYGLNDAFDDEDDKPFPKNPDMVGTEFPLTDKLREIANKAMAGRVCGPDDYLFINPRCNNHYTHRSIGGIFERLKKRAGYEVTLNEFGRHSFAVQLLQSGATYTQVAAMLGNSAQVVEANYSTWDVAMKAEIINLKDRREQESLAKFGK